MLHSAMTVWSLLSLLPVPISRLHVMGVSLMTAGTGEANRAHSAKCASPQGDRLALSIQVHFQLLPVVPPELLQLSWQVLLDHHLHTSSHSVRGQALSVKMMDRPVVKAAHRPMSEMGTLLLHANTPRRQQGLVDVEYAQQGAVNMQVHSRLDIPQQSR